jgi:hypothetical protein
MKSIAIFYHILTHMGTPPELLPNAVNIIREQMDQMRSSGLLAAAQHFVVGLNGGVESLEITNLIIPSKAIIVTHGLQSRAENLTIIEVEKFVKTHPDWNVLYFHCKGASHDPKSDYGKFSAGWRIGMMQDLVVNWRQCVADLETHDIVCSHWMWNLADGTQHIPAGNFLWITSNFATKLPTMYLRDRIKQDGISALSSRYEAEVAWGNGPKPVVKSYRPNGGGGVP